jgi:hypothetical protein
MVNDLIMYAAVMILCHIALLVFLIILSISGIVDVMFLVLTASTCSLMSDSMGIFKTLQHTLKSKLQDVAYCKVPSPELLDIAAIFLIR